MKKMYMEDIMNIRIQRELCNIAAEDCTPLYEGAD